MFTDVCMADMDRPGPLERIGSLGRTTPVCYVSDHKEADYPTLVLKHRVSEDLPKPLNPNLLSKVTGGELGILALPNL